MPQTPETKLADLIDAAMRAASALQMLTDFGVAEMDLAKGIARREMRFLLEAVAKAKAGS